MKTAQYTGLDGKKFDVEYDEMAPCKMCGHPVMEATMGGTDICPACDCGIVRERRIGTSSVMVIFKWGESVRAYNDLEDDSRFCHLNVGDEVHIESHDTTHIKKVEKIEHEPTYDGLQPVIIYRLI